MNISSIGEDVNGELYAAGHNGSVRQLIQLPAMTTYLPLTFR